jgi:hypothetical protein
MPPVPQGEVTAARRDGSGPFAARSWQAGWPWGSGAGHVPAPEARHESAGP